MTGILEKIRKHPGEERLTEAYEVRAFRDEPDQPVVVETKIPEIAHAEPGAFQAVKGTLKGHGEQRVLPDDCQFCDNDMCYVDA